MQISINVSIILAKTKEINKIGDPAVTVLFADYRTAVCAVQTFKPTLVFKVQSCIASPLVDCETIRQKTNQRFDTKECIV